MRNVYKVTRNFVARVQTCRHLTYICSLNAADLRKMDTGCEITNEYLAKETEKAVKRIEKYIRKTPLENSLHLSKLSRANVYLKLESQQLGGSFKSRGAFNKVMKYAEEHAEDFKDTKFITASSGNHGLGMTLALRTLGKTGVVYVAEDSMILKREILILNGAELRIFGKNCMQTEKEAMRAAKEENAVYVSPYNDPTIMAGQGTIATEILEVCKDLDAVFVTVGGGGLMSGVSSYLKHQNPKIQVIGCSPINSNCLAQSVKIGKQIDVDEKPTLSDGSAGNIDIPSATFPVCQRNVDRWVNVTEEEIADAIFTMIDVHHQIIEGAAGVALASFLKVKDDFQGQNVAVVLCGSNISTSVLKEIINSHT